MKARRPRTRDTLSIRAHLPHVEFVLLRTPGQFSRRIWRAGWIATRRAAQRAREC